jgi:hypothetical protein
MQIMSDFMMIIFIILTFNNSQIRGSRNQVIVLKEFLSTMIRITYHLEGLGVYGSEILKWVLEK